MPGVGDAAPLLLSATWFQARPKAVSTATVSRVFNDTGLVSSGTEIQVRAVATRLNYWPNGVARSLITNRTHTLGVLLPDLHGEFFSGVIRGLDVTARREGFHLLVSSSHSDTEELAGALRSMRGRIDGMVVMAPDVDTPSTIRDWAGDVPIVLIDPRGAFEEYHSVSIANLEGAVWARKVGTGFEFPCEANEFRFEIHQKAGDRRGGYVFRARRPLRLRASWRGRREDSIAGS